MTPFFMIFLAFVMIGLAKFIKYFGVPAPFGLILAGCGLLLAIFALVLGTYDSRR